MLNKIRAATRQLGAANAAAYLINRALWRLGGFVRIYRYLLVAQPVRQAPLLTGRRGRSIDVRPVEPGDPALSAKWLTAQVLSYRFGQGSICLGAFQNGAMIGWLWLTLGPYDEDEVRCRFMPRPAGQSAWDYDVFILPEYRTGPAFARLWDAANGYMRDRGIAWSFSRISAFNPASLASHRRLGARHIGTATYLCAGPVQFMVSSLAPYLHLSFGPRAVPRMALPPPDHADGVPAATATEAQ